jgi:hypothetical protein
MAKGRENITCFYPQSLHLNAWEEENLSEISDKKVEEPHKQNNVQQLRSERGTR